MFSANQALNHWVSQLASVLDDCIRNRQPVDFQLANSRVNANQT